jgi:hypothetical protein
LHYDAVKLASQAARATEALQGSISAEGSLLRLLVADPDGRVIGNGKPRHYDLALIEAPISEKSEGCAMYAIACVKIWLPH